mmetsp:Transcript_11477/g.29859  ORF Transcript_11477/g.29859 Transcript_11477/m.29859 type:complete len:763 (+) Transcript_11477:532-2820(+)
MPGVARRVDRRSVDHREPPARRAVRPGRVALAHARARHEDGDGQRQHRERVPRRARRAREQDDGEVDEGGERHRIERLLRGERRERARRVEDGRAHRDDVDTCLERRSSKVERAHHRGERCDRRVRERDEQHETVPARFHAGGRRLGTDHLRTRKRCLGEQGELHLGDDRGHDAERVLRDGARAQEHVRHHHARARGHRVGEQEEDARRLVADLPDRTEEGAAEHRGEEGHRAQEVGVVRLHGALDGRVRPVPAELRVEHTQDHRHEVEHEVLDRQGHDARDNDQKCLQRGHRHLRRKRERRHDAGLQQRDQHRPPHGHGGLDGDADQPGVLAQPRGPKVLEQLPVDVAGLRSRPEHPRATRRRALRPAHEQRGGDRHNCLHQRAESDHGSARTRRDDLAFQSLARAVAIRLVLRRRRHRAAERSPRLLRGHARLGRLLCLGLAATHEAGLRLLARARLLARLGEGGSVSGGELLERGGVDVDSDAQAPILDLLPREPIEQARLACRRIRGRAVSAVGSRRCRVSFVPLLCAGRGVFAELVHADDGVIAVHVGEEAADDLARRRLGQVSYDGSVVVKRRRGAEVAHGVLGDVDVEAVDSADGKQRVHPHAKHREPQPPYTNRRRERVGERDAREALIGIRCERKDDCEWHRGDDEYRDEFGVHACTPAVQHTIRASSLEQCLVVYLAQLCEPADHALGGCERAIWPVQSNELRPLRSHDQEEDKKYDHHHQLEDHDREELEHVRRQRQRVDAARRHGGWRLN